MQVMYTCSSLFLKLFLKRLEPHPLKVDRMACAHLGNKLQIFTAVKTDKFTNEYCNIFLIFAQNIDGGFLLSFYFSVHVVYF